MAKADLSSFDSYQGKALMLAQTKRAGVVRLMECNGGSKYVTHDSIHETGEGCTGHYFDDLDEAVEDFNKRVLKGCLT